MRIGMVGLGRMGANMTRRLVEDGHEVVAYDRNLATGAALADESPAVEAADDLGDLVGKLGERRVVWVMVPAGDPTATTLASLYDLLAPGDIVVNGGNCRWTDSVAYAADAEARGLVHLDAGVSGGIWGLRVGYCLMVGGPEEACAHVEPVFHTLAPEDGYARVGDSGAGHYAKMVHNGIEYAMLQSYAEGFDLLESSDYAYDLGQLAHLWRHGSVVRSWLLDLLADMLEQTGGDLSHIAPYVDDSGEGRWTVEAAISQAVPLHAISSALFARFASRRESYADRVTAALRHQFGGHAVTPIEDA